MTNNSIIRTDDDYLRAHITPLGRNSNRNTSRHSANETNHAASKLSSRRPPTSRSGKQVKLPPLPIRRTFLPEDSRRAMPLQSFHRPTARPPFLPNEQPALSKQTTGTSRTTQTRFFGEGNHCRKQVVLGARIAPRVQTPLPISCRVRTLEDRVRLTFGYRTGLQGPGSNQCESDSHVGLAKFRLLPSQRRSALSRNGQGGGFLKSEVQLRFCGYLYVIHCTK